MKKSKKPARRAPAHLLTSHALDHRVRIAELSASALADATGGSGPPKATLVADPGIDTMTF